MTSSNPQALLFQRWQSFLAQIATKRMSCDSVVALNRGLDGMEHIMEEIAEKASRDTGGYDFGLGLSDMEECSNVFEVEGEATPPVSDAPEDMPFSELVEEAPEADAALLERVTRAAKQLRQRQEEFKHLHNIAISKVKEVVEKVTQLKREIDQLQKDVVDDESELTYLKLKLRIIEIQTLPHVPRKDRDGLAAGIERWKLDWADVDKRYRKRRWKRETEACRKKVNLSVDGERSLKYTV